MKTLTSFAALAALAGINVLFTTGCGCDPGNNSQRAAIEFSPSSVQATRAPATCGVVDPAFSTSDTFTLALTGETDVAPPYTSITLRLTSVASVNQVPLTVSQGSSPNVTSAASNDGTIQFSFMTGSNAAELDANPLDSVIITVTSLPTADGQPLSAELHLTFEDGRVLDQVYSAPLESIVVPCAKQ